MACHLQIDADPDSAYHFDADPDPAYHLDAIPVPDTTVPFNLMRIRIRKCLKRGRIPIWIQITAFP
jgi:hypothetical protein